MARLLPLLLALLAWCAPAAAQVPWQTCTRCKATGKLCCEKHEDPQCAGEGEVLYCSVIAGCEVCGGTGFVPCGACVNPEARRKLEERRASIPQRAAALKSIDDTMGRPLRKAETAHFVFVWEMEGIKVDMRMVEAHEALHLYGSRMESLFTDYCSTLGIADTEFREKTWVFVWFLPKDHTEGSQKFCETTPTKGGVKLMGLHSRYSILGNRKEFRTDAQLHRNIVHSVSHLLLSAQRPTAWIGNMKGGWLDEGLAHWFEDRVSGICDNYCMQEENPNVDWEKGRYRFGIRKLVAKGDLPAISDITQRNVDTLTVEMNAIVFSYVDYLIPMGPEKLDALVKKLKNKILAGEAVRDVYGMNLLELEEKWKAWVLETYPDAMNLAWIAAATLFLAPAQDAVKPCVPCKSTGRVDCPKHPAAECALEEEVGYCSVVADCPSCGGAGYLPCDRCKLPAVREAFEKRQKWIRSRGPILKPIDDKMGRALRKAETAHFVLVWEMDKQKICKTVVSAHEAMHVYARRLEEVFEAYCAVLEIEPKALEERSWVFVWYLPKDQEQASGLFCDTTSKNGVTFLGQFPRYSVCGNKQSFPSDEALHRNLSHQVGHLLLSHQQPMAWLGERKSGWADEGLAYWLEERVNGLCDTYCQHEADVKKGFAGGKFRVGVRKLVAEDTVPSMAEVTQLDRDGLTPEMNAVSYSYVDYLSTLGGKKLDALMQKLKNRVPVRDVVQELYGAGLLELEARWKAWVLETYPVK